MMRLSLEQDADTFVMVVEIRYRYDSIDSGLVTLQKIGDIFSIKVPVTIPPVVLEQQGPVQVKSASVNKTTPQKNASNSRANVPKWTPEEIEILMTCPDHNEAWVAYQKVFTNRRNKSAIHQRWNKLHSREKSKRSTTKTVTKPTKLVVVPPENESAQDKLKKLIVSKNDTLSVGTKVKYNGSHASPFTGKAGEIEKIGTKDQILVKFGDSSSWISKECVVVIPEVPA